jgi:hypothetical protein
MWYLIFMAFEKVTRISSWRTAARAEFALTAGKKVLGRLPPFALE